MKERIEYGKIIERLQELRGGVQRDPTMATHTRQRYLAQISEQAPPVRPSASFIEQLLSYWRNRSRMLKTAVSVALTIVILFVGTGLTVQASQSSLPGDNLYPVKRLSENVQTAFTVGQSANAALAVTLAQRRIQEAIALAGQASVEETRHLSIESLIDQLNETMAKIAQLQETDPQHASTLAEQLGQSLTQHQQTLRQISEQAPAQQRERITNALANSQSLQQQMGQPDGGTPSQGQSDGEQKGRPADSDSADDGAVTSDKTPSAQQERDRDRIHTDDPGEGPQDDAGQTNQERGQGRNDDHGKNDGRPKDRDRDQEHAQQDDDEADDDDDSKEDSDDQAEDDAPGAKVENEGEEDDQDQSDQGQQGSGGNPHDDDDADDDGGTDDDDGDDEASDDDKGSGNADNNAGGQGHQNPGDDDDGDDEDD